MRSREKPQKPGFAEKLSQLLGLAQQAQAVQNAPADQAYKSALTNQANASARMASAQLQSLPKTQEASATAAQSRLLGEVLPMLPQADMIDPGLKMHLFKLLGYEPTQQPTAKDQIDQRDPGLAKIFAKLQPK